MLLNTSSVSPYGFWVLYAPAPGDSATVDQTTTCVQVAFACPHGLSLQSHLEAFFSCSSDILDSSAPYFSCDAQYTKSSVEQLPHKSSTAYFDGHTPHLPARCSYFVLFLSWASSKRSSHGTESSMMMFLVLSETRRMLGLRVVLTMCWGNLSCVSKSTSSCQSWAIARIPSAPFFCPALGCSLALTKAIAQVVLRTCLCWFPCWWLLQ